MHHPLSATRRVALTLAVTVVAGGLAACGTSPTSSTGATADSPDSGSASRSASTSPLVLRDGWVKAVEATGTASMPMTGLFGTLHNPTGSAVTVAGGTSPVAGKLELHETVRTASGSMRMQPKSGGLVIPAGGSQVLRPGGDHVMLMGLTQALPN
ncbi:MAG TPA: copper chaperone PCu(A)C, partial [Phycicoccus sp.]|nr:copper chaperone PCu(A)C [Phycicoccus sp.]